MENTNLSNALDATQTGDKVQYDQNVKELLADKQILSRILKYSLKEFENIQIKDIMQGISNICCRPVEPGLTNVPSLRRIPTESKIQNEGTAYFDILCEATCNNINYNIIINIEAQRSGDPKDLGYHIENRGVFYIARLISSQKDVVFKKSEYDKLKKVKSIWICMNCDEDSVVKHNFVSETTYGNYSGDIPEGQMEMIVIRLRNDKNAEQSKNILISMLEVLLRTDETIEEKKKNMENLGIVMSEDSERKVVKVCNLSEAVEQRGVKKGKIMGMVLADLSNEEIMEKTGESEKTIEAIREEMNRQK